MAPKHGHALARHRLSGRLPLLQPFHCTCACRATTVYLVQRRIDMLPKPLTEDICSLRGGVERLAFSVLWEVTPNVDVVNVRCGPCSSNSCAGMSSNTSCADMMLNTTLCRSSLCW